MIDYQIVGEHLQEIISQKTMGARFRFNLSPQAALNLLATHYTKAVLERNRRPCFDANTTERLKEVARYITQPRPKIGVMFCGPCGNGKTTMMQALKTATAELGRRHFSFLEDFSVNMEIIDAMDIALTGKDFDTLRKLRKRSMLGIDDLGKEPAEVVDYGTVLSPVMHLLEYRYEHQLFTAVTTNLVGREVREKYGSRIADRFNEMFEVIVFQDISYRTINRNG